MEKKYKLLFILFVCFFLITVLGFFKTYFQFFPKFENISIVTHFHFFLFFMWYALLFCQPLLIKQKQFALHRKLGKISYFLAPLMVFSILMMVKTNIAHNLSISKEQTAIATTGAFLDVCLFSTFYIISMVNKRNVRWHVAFLIAASLIVLNTGLGRLVTNLTNQQGLGILAMVFMPYMVLLTILFTEKIKLKRPILKSPYLLASFFWTLELALFMVIPKTEFWQKVIHHINEW